MRNLLQRNIPSSVVQLQSIILVRARQNKFDINAYLSVIQSTCTVVAKLLGNMAIGEKRNQLMSSQPCLETDIP